MLIVDAEPMLSQGVAKLLRTPSKTAPADGVYNRAKDYRQHGNRIATAVTALPVLTAAACDSCCLVLKRCNCCCCRRCRRRRHRRGHIYQRCNQRLLWSCRRFNYQDQ